MKRALPARAQRGFAIFAVLGVVLVMATIVAFTIAISSKERTNAGKNVHNQNVHNATESALQFAKGYFVHQYPNGCWDRYLKYFVLHPPKTGSWADLSATVAAVKAFDPYLTPTESGFQCFLYARDDIDEVGSPNDPTKDNNLFIFVGAVCGQQVPGRTAPLIAEVEAPLMFVQPTKYVVAGLSFPGSTCPALP